MSNPIQQLIYSDALADGLPDNLSNLVAAQAAHETGDFTSNAYEKDNNCFGYKAVPGGKWQEGNGITSSEGDPYAKYASVENSVHEIVDWIARRQKEGKFPQDLTTITTPLQYATLLKNCGYYGDNIQNYTAGIINYFQNFSNIA
jgi:uncharacterized FlgJ-related protein